MEEFGITHFKPSLMMSLLCHNSYHISLRLSMTVVKNKTRRGVLRGTLGFSMEPKTVCPMSYSVVSFPTSALLVHNAQSLNRESG